MKNQATFKDADKLATKLLEIFKNLAGNAKSFDPMIDGTHEVVVIKSEERLSAKGNPMREVKLRSTTDGRDVTIYIMKSRKKDWTTWEFIKVGQVLVVSLQTKNNFPNVTILSRLEKVELPDKPKVTNLKQTIYLYDIEIFKRDNLYIFRDYFTKEWTVIHNDLNTLRTFYLENRDSLFIGYNNVSYDNTVMRAHLQGKNPYHLSKAVIESDDRGLAYKMYNTNKTPLFSMDLYQDNRGFSLKEHSAFLGINIKETDVDFDIDRDLTAEEHILNELYCKNDVLATELRFEQQLPMLVAKATIALYFNMDKTALSMTNARLTAELLGAVKQDDRGDTFNKYDLPDNFDIKNEELIEAFMVRDFEKDEKGNPALSKEIEMRDLTEVLGVGGIHGAIDSLIFIGKFFADDVGSEYPNTMILFNMLSRNIPENKKHIYKQLLDERMKAKYSGEETINVRGVDIPTYLLINGFKLPLNTKYGAMGAEFNKLYDPRKRLEVCITGQVAMWDLLEKIEPHGKVIQSNTDAHYYIPFSDVDEQAILEKEKDWQERTGYTLDHDEFKAIFQKDVNNYLAITANGKVKIKGAIGLTGGMKVSKAIVSNAFINYIVGGKDYNEFINECTDLRQFQIITKTGWTFDDTVVRDVNGNETKAQKVNRVFAIKDASKGVALFKVKRGAEIEDAEEETTMIGEDSYTKGLANAPAHYAISNEAIGEGITIDEIDKKYYIEQVEDTLQLWFGENWKERIEQAHSEMDEFLPVKNYID